MDERLILDHMRELERLLHVLERQQRERHRQMERIIELLEGPATFPQATGAKVTSP